MAYQSGEFAISGRWSLYPYSAAVFNNTLFLISIEGQRATPHYAGLTKFDLSKLTKINPSPDNQPIDYEPIDGKYLIDQSNWITTESSFDTKSQAKPSLAALPDSMFLFINSGIYESGTLSSYKYPKSEDAPDSWSDSVTLLDSYGDTIVPSGSYGGITERGVDVSVTAFGDHNIIVTCASANSKTATGGGTYIGLYDTTQLEDGDTTWKAQNHSYLPFGNGVTADNATYISTDWYSTIGTDGNLENWVFLLVQSSDNPSTFNSFNLQISVGDDGTVELITMNQPNGSPSYPPQFPMYFADLKRDPGGRLTVWNSPRQSQDSNQMSFYKTYIPTTAPQNFFQFGDFNSSTDTITVTDTYNFPASLYYVCEAGKYTTLKGNGQDFDSTNYPVYEFIFYGGYEHGESLCQVNRCGTIQVVSDFSVTNPTQKPVTPGTTTPLQEVGIYSGIINGPIPFPLENFIGNNPGGGDDFEVGTLVYGTENSITDTRTVSNSWTAGFQSSGETTKGVGVAWDISLKGGTGSVHENSEGTSLSYPLPQTATIGFEDKYNPTVSNMGTLLQVEAQFSITAFNYLDEFGTSVCSTDGSDSNAPKTAAILTSFVNNAVKSYTLFDVKVGDLMSYTKEALNEAMKKSSQNYYEEIVIPNAYSFGDTQNPYLNFSWSEGEGITPKFTAFDSDYTENSWTFDLSVYAGVSGGGGIELWGFGEEFQAKFLAGGGYSHESTQSENKTNSWGIYVDDIRVPTSDSPKSVKSYEFRLYFLPVPAKSSGLPANYWTQELINYMPADSDTPAKNIDPNSACWKIMYVVTNIEYNDGTTYPTASVENNSAENKIR